MAINFPDNPTDGQTVTVGVSTYIYNASKGVWNLATTTTTGGGAADSDILKAALFFGGSN